MANIRTLKMNLLADVDNFTKGLDVADNDLNSFGTKIADFGKKAAVAFGAVITAAGYMAVRVAQEGMQMAADLAETMSKTNEVFKANSDDIITWSKTAGRSFGLTQQAALDSASTFALYGKSAGLSAKDTVAFSKKLVGLSADLASFYNTSPEDAAYALGAALRGESEPLRRYNILLDAATIKAAAMSSEFEITGQKTSATGKILGAYTSIMEQSQVAQGDFARTSDGLANQQRILAAEVGVTKVAFGEMFLPIAKDVTTWINDKMLPAIQGIIDGFKGTTGMTPAIRDATKLLDGVNANDYETPWYNLGEGLRSVADSFGKMWESIASPKAGESKSTIDSIADSLETFANAINAVTGAIEGAKNWLGKIGIEGLSLQSPLGAFTGGRGIKGILPGRAVGGSVKAGQAYRVGEMGAEVFVPDSNGRILNSSQMGGGTVININGVIDAESARRSIEKLLQNSARRTGAVSLVGQTL